MSDTIETKDDTKTPKVKAPRKYKITIHSDADGGDKSDVLIGHNFKLLQIKRNAEVEIDENFLNALKSSVIDTYVKGEDDKMHPVKVPRYSFTVEPV